MSPNAHLSVFRISIYNLEVCEKELTKVVAGGCGGCNPLEGIDCYTLKCPCRNHYLQELVFLVFL